MASLASRRSKFHRAACATDVLALRQYNSRDLPRLIADAAQERSAAIRKSLTRGSSAVGQTSAAAPSSSALSASSSTAVAALTPDAINGRPYAVPDPHPVLDAILFLSWSHYQYRPGVRARLRDFLRRVSYFNVNDLYDFPISSLPPATKHSDPLLKGPIDPLETHLEPLDRACAIFGHSSKWWMSSRNPAAHQYDPVPGTRMVATLSRFTANAATANDLADPFDVLTQANAIMNNGITLEDTTPLFDHQRHCGHALAMYINHNYCFSSTHQYSPSIGTGPTLLTLAPPNISIRQRTTRRRHVRIFYNIEQLRRPLPPAIVSRLKQFYAAEERVIEAYNTKHIVPTKPRSIPSSNGRGVVCISGATGEPLSDHALTEAPFPTKIFFTSDEVVELGLKILPNAVPTRAGHRASNIAVMNVGDYPDPQRAISFFMAQSLFSPHLSHSSADWSNQFETFDYLRTEYTLELDVQDNY